MNMKHVKILNTALRTTCACVTTNTNISSNWFVQEFAVMKISCYMVSKVQHISFLAVHQNTLCVCVGME